MAAAFQRNRFLATLAPDLQEQLARVASRMTFAAGHVLYADTVAPLGSVYFPERGVISIRNNYPSGAQVEIAAIGNDGAFGLSSILNVNVPATVAEVTIDVCGTAVSVGDFRRLCDGSPELRATAAKFLGAVFRDVVRSVGCYRFHTHDQWVARWLLTTADLVGDETLPVTHDDIARRLGSQRHAVSATLGEMKTAGLITLRRGTISIVDRPGLEHAACACYAEKSSSSW